MSRCLDWLPDLVLLESYQGNWDAYLEAIYKFFKADFVDSKPRYPGKRVTIRCEPITKGKEYAFWHFIEQGPTEEERVPELRRCERIRWPRPIIEAIRSENVKSWNTRRGRHRRIVIALQDFSYMVVLEDMAEYVIVITAYPVEWESRRRKFEKEYMDSKKEDAAP